MRPMIFLAAGIVLIAVFAGNGPAMLKNLEAGVARGVGFEVAHSLFHGGYQLSVVRVFETEGGVI
ncbi:MAG: hypothetical protein USCAAHI_01893 [Beijerinckiaceae bacterium]|nr:MAG: hypothetical protein USCAAHI_01893 [Beijerinckiaceae bacterium]